MFSFLQKLFEPRSDKQIKTEADQRLFQVIQRNQRRVRAAANEKTPKNERNGRANLRNLKLNSEKIKLVGLAELLKQNDLSTTRNPNYKINGNGVMLTVPFSTPNKFTKAMTYLNAIKNEKVNRGEFQNIDIVNVRPSNLNDSTLMFTLRRNLKIPLPDYFVRKLFGVVVPLDTKRTNITKEDVIQWSKYERAGKHVKYVKDLITAHKLIEEKKKVYELWDKHGDRIAEHVKTMRRVINPKNIPQLIGSNPRQEDALELFLKSAMDKYLNHEPDVYHRKESIDVKRYYAEYLHSNRYRLLSHSTLFPRFCNIPYDWRVHCVHETIRQPTNEQNMGDTWRGPVVPLLARSLNEKKDNKMNLTQKEINQQYGRGSVPSIYSYILRNLRPFLKQMFHTIGSIRYPHVDGLVCPFTRRDVVWKYELKRKSRTNNKGYDDSWMQILSEREGFTEELKTAHEKVGETLSELVIYYKTKVKTEMKKRHAITYAQMKEVDIELAWELYNICANKCNMDKHPMFRVCAGFSAINDHNPSIESKFMDRFRYMVHNKPRKNEMREPMGSHSMSHVEYVLTQIDVKFFFLSADIYKSEPNLYIKEDIKHNDGPLSFNTQNNTFYMSKGRGRLRMPQKDCPTLIDEDNVLVFEQDLPKKNGNVVWAWPTLKEASDHYISS